MADCGSFDLYTAALERMPVPLAAGLRERRRWARVVAAGVLRVPARKPTAGWALRRGMLVHGAATPLAYLDCLREYSLADHASLIRCPMWVCIAEEDDIGASAPQLVAALKTDKQFVRFRSADGAGDPASRALARSFTLGPSAGSTACLNRPASADGPRPPRRAARDVAADLARARAITRSKQPSLPRHGLRFCERRASLRRSAPVQETARSTRLRHSAARRGGVRICDGRPAATNVEK